MQVRNKYWVTQKVHSSFFPNLIYKKKKNPNELFGQPNTKNLKTGSLLFTYFMLVGIQRLYRNLPISWNQGFRSKFPPLFIYLKMFFIYSLKIYDYIQILYMYVKHYMSPYLK